MILPIAGAVLHIILKAFGRRGIDNAPTYQEPPPIKDDGDGSPVEGKPNDTKNPSKT